MRRVAVILAGGSGTRLWPLSRRNRPKQLLRFLGGQSLLQATYERLRQALEPDGIYIVALEAHRPAIAAEVPDLPRENIIGEPMGRDTAAAVALAAAVLHRIDPQTTMGVFTADHVIRPADRFVRVLQEAYEAAGSRPGALITFGIRPTGPHTGMGYLQRGQAVAPNLYRVRAFREKPDAAAAQRLVAAGDCFWNSGMFVWRTDTILRELQAHLPATHAAALRLAGQWNTPAGAALARELYPSLERISIDFAVMERARDVLMREMDVEWLDVGSWTALAAVLGRDAEGNTKALPRLADLSSRNCIFVCEDEHLVAAIGVADLVVVHSADATLICHQSQVQRIKDLLAEIERDHPGRYS